MFAIALALAGLYGIQIAKASGAEVAIQQTPTPIPGAPPERTTPDPPVRRGPEAPVTVPRAGGSAPTESPASRNQTDKATTSDQIKVINDAIVVLNELTATPDNAIPTSILQRAEAIIVIPSLLKGGFIVGAKHGKGIMSTRDASTGAWSAPAFVNMTGGSIGWQIGAEAVDLVLLVMNKKGVTELLEDKFTLGGTASVSAGPVGRSAAAGTNAQMQSQILGYSRARGLFAGVALEGGKLHADDSDIKSFYGRGYTVSEVVGGKVSGPLPPAVDTWQSAIARVSR
jgi:lipid-binding SYLF domain-containing protein